MDKSIVFPFLTHGVEARLNRLVTPGYILTGPDVDYVVRDNALPPLSQPCITSLVSF